jgi:tRNA A-37 threonylcarbamoyl transferase component Bud32
MPTGGFRLEDSYRILKTIGRGGFGEVLLAEQVSLGRKVVIKTIRAALAADETAKARFRKEALVVAGLRHPNVVTYHDFHEDSSGNLYIVMEYLEGATLTDLLKERGRLPAEEAVPLLVDLCRALEASHAAGVVHRDLKPSNVLLVGHGDDRRAVLIDFGLLKQMHGEESLTAEGLLLGTPTYMAPEQIQAKGVGPRTDLYALGVIAYEMLAGSNPFRTPDLRETVFRHLHHEPRNLATLDPRIQVSRNLATLVARMLEKDPERRLQSAEEVRRLLRESQTFSERSTYMISHLPGFRSLRTRVALGVVLALLVGGVSAAVLVPRLQRTHVLTGPRFPDVLGAGRRALAWRLPPAVAAVPMDRRRPERTLTPLPLTPTAEPAATSPKPATAKSTRPRPTGTLTVNSKFWGYVTVDGIDRGVTPLRELELPAGTHRVRVTHPRHGEWTRQVTIRAGKSQILGAELKPPK